MVLIGVLTVSLYVLTLTSIPALPSQPLAKLPPIPVESPELLSTNQLIIPKIGVIVPIVTGGFEALDQGVWHRFPERGNPLAGGNFILSAHRFKLGWTPQMVRKLSPFYHIDELDSGDSIFVDYEGVRYSYLVDKTYQVKPDEIAIEDQTENPKLTLYSCTLKGEADGRTVIEAWPAD